VSIVSIVLKDTAVISYETTIDLCHQADLRFLFELQHVFPFRQALPAEFLFTVCRLGASTISLDVIPTDD
jgi:hypothetical protein